MAARSAVIEAELDREMALLREQLMEEEEEQRHRWAAGSSAAARLSFVVWMPCGGALNRRLAS